MTEEVDEPLMRGFAVVREAIRVEGARWGGGRAAWVVSTSSSIKASVLRFALMP